MNEVSIGSEPRIKIFKILYSFPWKRNVSPDALEDKWIVRESFLLLLVNSESSLLDLFFAKTVSRRKLSNMQSKCQISRNGNGNTLVSKKKKPKIK